MEPFRVGIREFRENLASYLLESSSPVAITRHGDTIGYFIPARRTRSQRDRQALKEAAGRLAALLADRGISEEELLQDFKRLRSTKRK
ncbi:MAG TPA: prevent-host-death protein [Candidatus Angelobacter sp.]|jgi:antitoxin (DNA-binding transcriptional repressor) of toxin-antitoxin stability system|nr:prevent-host-death protein [Candidatus Angelobacter sp.]